MHLWGLSVAPLCPDSRAVPRTRGRRGKDAFRRELIEVLSAEPMAPGP